MIGDPAPLRARSGRNPGRGGRVRRPETPKLVAAKRGNDETAGPSTPIGRHRTQARPPVREARSRLRLYLARLSKMYLSVRPGPVSVTAEVLRPDAGLPANRRTEDGRGHALPTHTVHAPPHAHHASHLGFALYSRAMLQPSRPRLAVPQESAARVGPRDVGAPGRSVPVGRRATTAGSRRTGALCGLARTDKQHKRRRTINLSRPHFSHDGHESE